jgi:hypothetical protein
MTFQDYIQQMPTVDDSINAIVKATIAALEDGNVYVGDFGEAIIRDAIRKAIIYRIAAL